MSNDNISDAHRRNRKIVTIVGVIALIVLYFVAINYFGG